MTRRTRLLALALVLLAVPGCGDAPGHAVKPLRVTTELPTELGPVLWGDPPGTDHPTDAAATQGAAAAWAAGGQLAVARWGSGSCPRLPYQMAVHGTTIKVWTKSSGRDCTADLSPTTAYLAVPDTLAHGRQIRLVLDGYELKLPPYQGVSTPRSGVKDPADPAG